MIPLIQDPELIKLLASSLKTKKRANKKKLKGSATEV